MGPGAGEKGTGCREGMHGSAHDSLRRRSSNRVGGNPFGKAGEETIMADEIASWLDTISYEILTSIGRRVPRTYKNIS